MSYMTRSVEEGAMRHFEIVTETVFKDFQLISTITKQIVDICLIANDKRFLLTP